MTGTHTIRLLPMDRPVSVERGAAVLCSAKPAGVHIDAPCGGAPGAAAPLIHGVRAVYSFAAVGEKPSLACEAKVMRTMAVRVPVRP